VTEAHKNDHQGRSVTAVPLPRLPSSGALWSRAVLVVTALVLLFTLDRITVLLGDFWLLQSLGHESVFWTNFRIGTILYLAALVVFAVAAVTPAFTHDLRETGRLWAVLPGILVATLAAYALATRYQDFLFGVQGVAFGQTDPVFGHDLGFYVFDLPYYWVIWQFALAAALVMLAFSVACAYIEVRREPARDSQQSRLVEVLGRFATVPTRIAIALAGVVAAAGTWLSRYELLLADNSESSVHVGAEAIDVTGFFSNLNYITVTTLVILGLTVGVVLLLGRWHAVTRNGEAPAVSGSANKGIRRLALVMAGLVVLDFAFKGLVALRDEFYVEPNEPVIQLEYIDRHIRATRQGSNLKDIERIEYRPNEAGEPLPDPDTLLNNPALANLPLWPGFASYLERVLDPHHADRILKTGGDPMVYGPTLDQFQQQQKLRTYYRFLDVDFTRYPIDGEKRILASAVRELPLFEPVPWLSYFGQRYMLYTHGFGLAAAPANKISPDGGVDFISYDIPSKVATPELAVNNERVYYGEGAATMAFSNVDQMQELDYPTDQGRAELQLPAGETTSVPLDSIWRRLAIGWQSGHLVELLFSDLITDDTRVHFYRRPIERLQRVAPYLFYDTNIYAVAAEGRITWMVNGMSISDKFPYARYSELGDKSDERSPFPGDNKWVNYVEDSVKATVDAYSGEVTFYKVDNNPVIDTWESIYPGLFTDIDKMPGGLRRQITYPTQLFHYQFDDLYIYYHMNDPMYFFNLEDMWDDGDEVLGPVIDSGKAITFSIEPYPLIMATGGLLPESGDATQYSMLMPFTPEKALNLRAIPMVYQDGADYGKLAVLEVPKGNYIMGPEQADALIDQDPEISQNLSWWTRRGMEVTRGHTLLVPFANEVMYVEPIFLRSQQNPVSQLKKVAVVFRERVAMGDSLEQAVRKVFDKIEGSGAGSESPPSPVASPAESDGGQS